MSPASQGDNNATFLAEFRALRNRAGLDYQDLAARTHFPSDVLREAETGPDLPGLPVLAAYVRACDADVTEWEERWRLLAGDDIGLTALDEQRDDADLPVRPAGASPAAKAGARAGVSVAPADVHDPERIKAALRAHRAREDSTDPDTGTGTATDDDAEPLANGHHGPGAPAESPVTNYSPAAEPAEVTMRRPSPNGYSPRPHAPASRARQPSGNGQLKLVVLVLVVLIGCILLITIT
jgi:hypothetical protein